MNRKTVSSTLMIILLVTIFLSAAPSAQAQQCSMAGAAGKYAFTLTGVLITPAGPVPGAAVGRATLSAEGNVSGTEARNVGGGFADETFTGTTTVNPDCTGIATIKFFESGVLVRTSVISIVFDDNMKEFRFVQKSLTLPDGTNVPVVVTGEAKKMFPGEEQG